MHPLSVRRAIAPALVMLALGCARAPNPGVAAVPVLPGVTQAGVADDASNVTMSVTDLDRRTSELFGDATGPGPMRLSEDSALLGGGDASPSWDIDVHSYVTFDRVRHYVSAFSGPARERIGERLSEGTRYEAMIRSKLRAGGLPEDMYYLALVESGFNPHAYSRAAAVGMWQFMTATGKGVGLRIDWWIDERRDPVRSTDAAVRFLSGLNEQFGSMYLAAAAYNGGPGRIARGLTRFEADLEGTTGDDLFFALADKKYLRAETSNYVPQLIAAALVAKEAERYGLTVTSLPVFEYDSVRVGALAPLAAIAVASGTTVDTIKDLNPHILRGMTAPGRDSAWVRVPVGTQSSFDSVYATLPAEERTGARTVKAGNGATWATLGRKHNISARSMAVFNPRVKANRNSGRIAAGTTVLVPAAAVVDAARSVPDPAIEIYGSGSRTHVVRSGENLSVIAKRYGTTPAAIMRLNRMKKAMIFPGQQLRISAAR
ncbi:MAG: transglycosylase SLT domain-containing protein [Gemmatimonadaceae bacterium]